MPDTSRFMAVGRKLKHHFFTLAAGVIIGTYGWQNFAFEAVGLFDLPSYQARAQPATLSASTASPGFSIDALIAALSQQRDWEEAAAADRPEYDRAGLDALVKKAGRK